MFECRQQEGAEPTALSIGRLQSVSFQQRRKEGLRQILSFVNIGDPPTSIRVEARYQYV